MTAEQIRHARDLLTRPENTVSSIASSIARLGVSRATSTSTSPTPRPDPASCGPAPRTHGSAYRCSSIPVAPPG